MYIQIQTVLAAFVSLFGGEGKRLLRTHRTGGRGVTDPCPRFIDQRLVESQVTCQGVRK